MCYLKHELQRLNGEIEIRIVRNAKQRGAVRLQLVVVESRVRIGAIDARLRHCWGERRERERVSEGEGEC